MNIFQDPSKSVPKKAQDPIVRVDMEQNDVGGRKSNLPKQEKNDLNITHVGQSGPLSSS